MSRENREPIALDRWVQILLATILVSVALYLARVVFEPIAFALFGMALLWPFQKALEARLPKAIALLLTILLALFAVLVRPDRNRLLEALRDG